ncbi:Rho guanyl nucleotide exchange [Grosmannia clavigera kw1407]|uniref:Rho guanyl nucleotide exchange n=1 Tax=Grosmannia clavigera (strain kw1407 / UAMH 11150) TaxID=655863 RepID=F0XKQ8_GROCL|nr:Rho guanyl nucleotide exchange [Grosmannia clavigera kw1407]EFX01702.1 Rho guanyl nucleotide exchange [Grosmannia clavigera kw1407]
MDDGDRDEARRHLHLDSSDDRDDLSGRGLSDHFDGQTAQQIDSSSRFDPFILNYFGRPDHDNNNNNNNNSSSSLPYAPLSLLPPFQPSLLPPVAFHGAVDLPALDTPHPAVHSNALSDSADSVDPVDPIDFYRSYPQQDAQFHTATTAADDAMAPAASGSRQIPVARFHANGLSPKSPTTIPSSLPGYTNGFRSNSRSVSSPIDSSSPSSTSAYSRPAPTAARARSVKDLKKRYDQIAVPSSPPSISVSSTSSRLRPTARPSMSSSASSSSRSRSPATGVGTASANRVKSPAGRLRQQAPSQHESSPQSFASRIAKPSMTQLSSPVSSPPRSARRMASPPPPMPSLRTNGLLFGEILPDEADAPLTLGYGINTVRPRRTSDSSAYPARPFTRSRSEAGADPEPASPTDWYRGVLSTQAAEATATANSTNLPIASSHTQAGRGTRIPASHSRAHSDLAGSKPRDVHTHHRQRAFDLAASAGADPLPSHSQSETPPPSSPQQRLPSSPTSRLPISVKKQTDPSARIGRAISRSSSPGLVRRPASATSRSARQLYSPPVSLNNAKAPARRTATPTSPASGPARSKPSTSSSRKLPPAQLATPSSSRLNAYASVPPAKLSPTLRSSRPRQPVSSATGKMSAHGSTRASLARQEEAEARRRKIDVGPIDFARRRETIRLAYSKSIRETEAKATRQAAAERRRKELEEAARAKGFAEAAVLAQTEANRRAAEAAAANASTASSSSTRHFPLSAPVTVDAEKTPESWNANVAVATGATATSTSDEPVGKLAGSRLKIVTDMPESQSDNPDKPTKRDSPTLGIPGTFPDPPVLGSPPLEPAHEGPPRSAISAHSGVTEFDNEAQTDLPLRESGTAPLSDAAFLQQQQQQQQQQRQQQHEIQLGLEREKAEYRSPFDGSSSEDPLPPTTEENQHVEKAFRHRAVLYRFPFQVKVDSEQPSVGDSYETTPADSITATRPLSFVKTIPGSYHEESDVSRPVTPVLASSSMDAGHFKSPSLDLVGEHETPRRPPRDEVATLEIPIINETNQGTDSLDAEPISKPQAAGTDVTEQFLFLHRSSAEYEPQPFRSESNHTTVTILSRETQLAPAPMSRKSSRLTMPEDARLDAVEDFYVGPSLRDNVWTLRDSAFASSDVSDDARQASGSEPQQTPDTSNSLNVPHFTFPANRSSQQSGWTDFSVESADAREYIAARELASSAAAYNTSLDSVMRGQGAAATTHQPHVRQRHNQRRQNHFHFDSRPGSYADMSEQNDDCSEIQEAESVGVSSLEQSAQDISLSLDGTAPQHHRLPEVDTGSNFYIPYLSRQSPAKKRPARPEHDPPPVPVPSEGHNSSVEASGRPSSSSAYYDSSRPNSYIQGMALRDDQCSFTSAADGSIMASQLPPVFAPRPSFEQSSLDMGHQSISGATLVDNERLNASGAVERTVADSRTSIDSSMTGGAAGTGNNEKRPARSKEQARLVQRQMVIRELIDTEAVFVRDMNIVEEIYKGTAEACPQLDDKTVKLIFRNSDEIIAFHTAFLVELKEAVSSVYAPKSTRRPSPATREGSTASDTATAASSMLASDSGPASAETDEDTRDRQTHLGPVFRKNIDKMRLTHEGFLRSSDSAAKRLIQIQEDPTVNVWLNECNEVAKDLTAAWNLDSLLIKPMQRITKYPNLISQLLQYTPADHPDRPALMVARSALETAILDINKTKKNFELVGQIVGRKRKDSDVRAGFARAFGKRVDKLQASNNRPAEDAEYTKLNEKFGDDYLRLQVVLRDVEFYTRQVTAYVHEFLQFLSAMELVMRLQPSPYPELESKWARFNVSMRDMEKVALDQHVRKHVIEPFEQVIKCYGNPSLAMKKRAKRRLDFERAAQLKKANKKVDKQLAELVEQYEALNDALKRELPMLSANTEKIGNICLGNFVSIQVRWYAIWKEKVRVVLDDSQQQGVPEIADIVATFTREFRDMEEHIHQNLTILNRDGRSEATGSISMSRSRSRPSDMSPRVRAGSINSDSTPSLPTPDFGRRSSGHFGLVSPTPSAQATAAAAGAFASPTGGPANPNHYYYYRSDYYGAAPSNGHARGGSASPITPGLPAESSGRSVAVRRDSSSTYNSNQYPASTAAESVGGGGGGGGSVAGASRRFSGLFSSAMPMQDEALPSTTTALAAGMMAAFIGVGGLDGSSRPSRASSRERPTANTMSASSHGAGGKGSGRYHVLWLAASLFEFNIETKHEAGYPYLTYQAGEVFDVIAEKGELWLAKNQDDPRELVGWIWSKHFAKLADS